MMFSQGHPELQRVQNVEIDHSRSKLLRMKELKRSRFSMNRAASGPRKAALIRRGVLTKAEGHEKGEENSVRKKICRVCRR